MLFVLGDRWRLRRARAHARRSSESLTDEQRGVGRSLAVLEALTGAPEELTQELDQPFAERVLDPLLERLTGSAAGSRGADHGRADPAQARPRRQPAGLDRRPGRRCKVLGAIVGARRRLAFVALARLGLSLRSASWSSPRGVAARLLRRRTSASTRRRYDRADDDAARRCPTPSTC